MADIGRTWATAPANAAFRRFLKKIEPWYNWGTWGAISVKDETCADGRFFVIQWLGFQLLIAATRFPSNIEER